MSEPLPRGWCHARVEDLVSFVQYGSSSKTSEDESGVPVLRMGNIVDGRLNFNVLKYLPKQHNEFPTLILNPGDVLFNRTNSPELVGKTAVYTAAHPAPCSFASYLIRLRLHAYDPELLTAYLNSELGRAWIRSCVTQQVGQANVSGGKLKELELPVPPQNEQLRIVAKLNDLLARSRRARAALDAIPPLLDKLRQAILAAAFRGDLTADWRAKHPDVEPAEKLLARIRVERRRAWEAAELARLKAKGRAPTDDRWKEKYKEPEPVDTSELPELPEGWGWTSVEAIGEVHLGRQRAPQYQTGRFSRPYLRVANIKDDRIDLSDVLEMDFDEDEFEHYCLRKGDILLSEGQSPELVGQSAIYRGDIPGLCFQKTLHRFRPYPLVLSPEFAQLIFRHYLKSGTFQAVASLTVNIAHLTLERLKPLHFPLAPADEQKVIVQRASAALARVGQLAKAMKLSKDRGESLESAILAKAFRGELVPQDPNDEPASVLLERIRAERAQTANGTTRSKKSSKVAKENGHAAQTSLALGEGPAPKRAKKKS